MKARFLLILIFSYQLAFGQAVNFNRKFTQLLKNNEAETALDQINQLESQSTEPAEIKAIYNLYRAVAYDNIQLSDKAATAAEAFLSSYLKLDINRLNALEIYFRSSNQPDDKYLPDFESYRSYKQIDNNLANKMQHAIFLYLASQNKFKQAMTPFVADGKLMDLNYKFDEKLLAITDVGFASDTLTLLNELAASDDLKLKSILNLADLQIANNQLDLAEQTLQLPLALIPNKKADYLRKEVTRIKQGQKIKVGVILPIGMNPFQLFANQIIAGLNFGIQYYGLNSVDFVFVDPTETEKGTISAYKNLIENEHVALIIGPLTKLTTESLNSIVKDYNIPFISYSLSVNRDAIPFGSKTFQRNLKQEAIALANYTAKNFCKSNSALLYDDNSVLYKQIFLSELGGLNSGKIKTYSVANYKKNLSVVYNKITGLNVYESGSSLYDATTNEIKDFNLNMLIDFLPADSINLIYQFNRVYKIEDLQLSGLSNLANPTFTNSGFNKNIYFSDSVSYDQNYQELKSQISLDDSIFNNANLGGSYVYYGLLTVALLKSVDIENLTSRQLFNKLKAASFSTSLGDIYQSKYNELYVKASVLQSLPEVSLAVDPKSCKN